MLSTILKYKANVSQNDYHTIKVCVSVFLLSRLARVIVPWDMIINISILWLFSEPRNISFQAIYSFLPFKSLDGVMFLEEVPIQVQVTEVERFTSTRVMEMGSQINHLHISLILKMF